ncbi:hypothetical protein B5X24_HaOG206929 [Helicoverpa armigera]|nr:hypothetical protein B5X24_HaOG206929 [Helicoverpa armigera]
MAGKIYFALALVCIIPIVYACNEAICASVVSKCMLTQSCKCDLKDCSCCKDCFNCLSYLYSECCSCVDMCPKPNDTQTELSKTSYVEELADGVPGLFAALTSDPDPQQSRDVVTLNCTVAYMSQCMSSDKCRASCRSMGANGLRYVPVPSRKFSCCCVIGADQPRRVDVQCIMGSNGLRWFHDGCCECVGDKCFSYGINESRCLACPGGKETAVNSLDEDLTYDDLDYGEEVDAQAV